MKLEAIYQHHCVFRNPLPCELEIDRLEGRLGIRFPLDYRDFLAEYNGGTFQDLMLNSPWRIDGQDVLRTLFGVIPEPAEKQEFLGDPADVAIFDDNWPLGLLSIGYTEFGDLILMLFTDGDFDGIFLKQSWEDEGFHLLSETFAQMVSNLYA